MINTLFACYSEMYSQFANELKTCAFPELNRNNEFEI